MLIVDDNATNRRILEEWLRGWQMEPAAVGDGLAALDALWRGAASGRPYALVLLDARMPDTDGLALAAKIREQPELAATRIILLTSGDLPGDRARFRELRIDAHLLKPVQQDELLETIYRVMSRGEHDSGTSTTPTQAPAATPPDSGPRHRCTSWWPRTTSSTRSSLEVLTRRGHRSAGEQRPGGAGPGARACLRPAAPGRPHAGLDGFQVVRGDPGAGEASGGPSARHRPDGALAE